MHLSDPADAVAMVSQLGGVACFGTLLLANGGHTDVDGESDADADARVDVESESRVDADR